MDRELVEDGWQGFSELCISLESSEEFRRLGDLFFTSEERETLASRLLIIKALLEGELTQREIAEKYKVSIAQITRGSNALKIIDDKLKMFLKKQL